MIETELCRLTEYDEYKVIIAGGIEVCDCSYMSAIILVNNNKNLPCQMIGIKKDKYQPRVVTLFTASNGKMYKN